MRLLIDTNVLLWIMDENPKLSQRARAALSQQAEEAFVSAVSMAEIHIKKAIGKLRAADSLDAEIVEAGFEWLPFEPRHAHWLSELPLHHRDPFDRMLIAQAIEEGMSILTSDDAFQRYPVHVIRN